MRCPTLNELPPSPVGKTGWPWTEGTPQLPDATPDGQPWPVISIVTPSYNQGQFLEEAIRSVLLQGYPALEYIIIDGGSTDHSGEIIKKYEQWLTYWCSEPDRGPANALNKGFHYATGEILGFLNSDDFYLSRCFGKVTLKFLRDPSSDILYGDGYMLEMSNNRQKALFSDRWNRRRFAYGACVLVQQATFFRHQVFARTGGFNELNRTCWDAELWADLALSGGRFCYFEDSLAVFRIHDASITGNIRLKAQYLLDKAKIFEKVVGRQKRLHDLLFEFIYRILKASGRLKRARLVPNYELVQTHKLRA